MQLTYELKIRCFSFVFICIMVPFQLSFAQGTQKLYLKEPVVDKNSELKEIGAMIANAQSPEVVMDRWNDFIENERSTGVPLDINSLVQEVLAGAYLETNSALQYYHDRLTYFQRMKESVRNELAKIRQYRAEITEDATLKSINLYVSQLEQLLDEIDGLKSLASHDLQEWEQRRSAHFSVIWHAVKVMSDSAKKRLLRGQ